MNKFRMKKLVACFALTSSVLFLTQTASAEAPATAGDECSQEILLSYFPGVFVSETLTKFNVPQDQWAAIKQELQARDKEIIKQVEAKAAKVNPNPLKDPEQRQAAVKLFRETLSENFSAVLKAHGVKDDKQIQAMLDDIQQQKAKRFAHCMELQRKMPAGQPQGAAAPATKGNLTADAEVKSVQTPASQVQKPAVPDNDNDDSDDDSEDDEG